MNIKATSFYILADYPGISGFKDYSKKVEWITTGLRARRERGLVVREYKPCGSGIFKLADGHLPEFQPTAKEFEALEWLLKNPLQSISVFYPVLAPQPAPSFSNSRACSDCGVWSPSGGSLCEDCEIDSLND